MRTSHPGSQLFSQSGHNIASAFPPNAGEILPWRMQFKIRPPLWRVQTLGCFSICLVLADKNNYLADTIQNLSAILAGNKFELCLALLSIRC